MTDIKPTEADIELNNPDYDASPTHMSINNDGIILPPLKVKSPAIKHRIANQIILPPQSFNASLNAGNLKRQIYLSKNNANRMTEIEDKKTEGPLPSTATNKDGIKRHLSIGQISVSTFTNQRYSEMRSKIRSKDQEKMKDFQITIATNPMSPD